jgi:hypothetical protein
MGAAAISVQMPQDMTCFRFFGQVILLFWTARGKLSDVENQIAQAW